MNDKLIKLKVMTDYDIIGNNYNHVRQSDPRIAQQIRGALGGLKSVINVGAGTGSYEPKDMVVVAVEPSEKMIEQRADGMAKVVKANAEKLPFPNRSFDAAMAMLSMHHWSDWKAGIREMRRVARNRIVILTYFPDLIEKVWFELYFPSLMDRNSGRFLKKIEMEAILGPAICETVPIPHDCRDGFLHAYWQRPSAYLDPRVRQGISTFCRAESKNEIESGLARLANDIDNGWWNEQWGYLNKRSSCDMGYRLLSWTFE